jgi:hypothetical protein
MAGSQECGSRERQEVPGPGSSQAMYLLVGHAGGRRQLGARSEHFTEREVSALLRALRSSATWENGLPHSGSVDFADTEEVTGSNPVAPTR